MHEHLRDGGMLHYLDSLEEAVALRSHAELLFFPHQWLGFHEPDAKGEHYRAMLHAADLLTAHSPPHVTDCYIWGEAARSPARVTAQGHAPPISAPPSNSRASRVQRAPTSP